jgi:hypothetical protein
MVDIVSKYKLLLLVLKQRMEAVVEKRIQLQVGQTPGFSVFFSDTRRPSTFQHTLGAGRVSNSS